ncbi:hypothetical protein SAMN05444340_102206 [Citreimonas salinaria]|uniref:Uncharacterized protein n=1 Tax=Citreimonas salinaria TaxID=321339 RepID=A0A1H3G896_9RHOB|nr:hypothetical protein SAMN05444340_102206 [Citreimonas salinaria]
MIDGRRFLGNERHQSGEAVIVRHRLGQPRSAGALVGAFVVLRSAVIERGGGRIVIPIILHVTERRVGH